MSTVSSLVEVDGWQLRREGEELLIRDVLLGERLGYERPRKIRDLIARLEAEGKLSGVQRRPTVGRRGFAEEIVDEAWLTERQALKIVAKSDTEIADALLEEVIDVFVKARAGLLPTSTPSISREEVAQLEGRVVALERAVVKAAAREPDAKTKRELYDDLKPQRPTRDELEAMLLAAAGNPKLRWTHRHQLALVAGWRSRPVLAELIAAGAIVEIRNPRRLVTRELAGTLGRIEVPS